jgi:hypothetical protein
MGSEANALATMLSYKQKHGEDPLADSSTTVRIAEDQDTVLISFGDRTGGARSSYTVDRRSMAVEAGGAMSSGSDIVNIDGIEARAISALTEDLELRLPILSSADVEAGKYTISIRDGSSSRDGAAGYTISVEPLKQPAPSSGINCRTFRNYFVRKSDLKIEPQPVIC